MESKIYCFKHKNYDGTTAPVISCKTCCSIFLKKVKANTKSGVFIEYQKLSLDGTGLAARLSKNSI